jgi:hypothetical protein
MELQIVRAAEDVMDRSAVHLIYKFRQIDQPWAQNRVLQIGTRLRQ